MYTPTLRGRAQPTSLGTEEGDAQGSSGTTSIPERLRQWSHHRDILRNLSSDKVEYASSDESDIEVDTAGVSIEDASGLSTLGVSISKRQSRLASFETPAAERAAILRDNQAEGVVAFLDGVDERETTAGQQEGGRNSRQGQYRSSRFSISGRRPGTSAAREAAPQYPAPATYPKYFDTPTTSFLSNVGSLFGLRRTSSPDLPSRSGRDEQHKGLLRLPLRSRSRKRSGSVVEDGARSRTRKTSIFRQASIDPPAIQSRANEQNGDHFIPKPLMRRTTSDSALIRPLSATPSLGDDTRWEHIHEMMNSRSRAIKDSFVDANIRFPAMRDFTSFSFPSSLPLQTQTAPDGIAPPLPNRAPPGASSSSILREKEAVSPPRASSKVSPLKHPHFASALDKLTGDIVIMGGYRGSVLRSAKAPYRQQWIPIKVGLNLRRVDLELGLDPEDEETEHTRIIPSGMLQNIGPIDISRRLLKRLRASKNAQEGRLRVWDFGYDWRLSPLFLSAQLVKFLETLPCNQPNVPKHERGATMISHSLGGLLTRHAINTKPLLVKHVLYAGVPQYCVNILGPLRNGDDVLLSSRVLTAQTNFTIRTTFALLPLDGKCFFDAATKEAYDIDFFDPATYEEYRLTPVIARPFPALATAPQNNSNSSIFSSIVGSVSGMLPNVIGNRKNSSNTSISTTSSSRQTNSGLLERVSSREDTTGSSPAIPTPHHHSNLDNSNSANAMKPQINDHSGDHDPTSDNPATHVTIPHHLAYAYLTRTLASIKKFKQELAYNPALSHLYPSTAVLFGKSYPTVSGCRVVGREGIKRADAYDDLVFGSGDGVVLARAAMLPEGYESARGGVVSSERGHIGLLGDLEGVGRCLEAVLEEGERRGRERGRGKNR